MVKNLRAAVDKGPVGIALHAEEMTMRKTGTIVLSTILLLLAALTGVAPPADARQGGKTPFSFVVTTDMRKFSGPAFDTSSYFRPVVRII